MIKMYGQILIMMKITKSHQFYINYIYTQTFFILVRLNSFFILVSIEYNITSFPLEISFLLHRKEWP